ncbi:low molecular weight protein-tyrosine-phosphatase [Caulobacter henricii]|nr:low molecular weight protein-tyrosine-phosphatase [Caulobacter henricii]
MRPSVLFVCLGNICRSPLAEGAFRAEAQAIGLDVLVDSAGTGGWHVGSAPDGRAIAAAQRHGVDISRQTARKVEVDDFRRFTHILALDHDNLKKLRSLRPVDGEAELGLLLDYAEGLEGRAVADPYYGKAAGFDVTWREVALAARGLAQSLASRGD